MRLFISMDSMPETVIFCRNVKWAILAAGIVAIAGFLLYKDSTSLQDAKASLLLVMKHALCTCRIGNIF